MKKKVNNLTESEIKTLKTSLKISYIAQKHGFSKQSNYAYRIMRTGVSNKNSRGYAFLKELKEALQFISSN